MVYPFHSVDAPAPPLLTAERALGDIDQEKKHSAYGMVLCVWLFDRGPMITNWPKKRLKAGVGGGTSVLLLVHEVLFHSSRTLHEDPLSSSSVFAFTSS